MGLLEASSSKCFRQPFVRLPRIAEKPSAILPSAFITRCTSRSPATACGQYCIELIASALSNLLSSNGRLSTEPCRSANGRPQRRPGTESSHDSLLEGDGFELPVRGRGQSGCRPFWAGCALRSGSGLGEAPL